MCIGVVAALGVLGVVPGVAVADGLDERLVHRGVDGQVQSVGLVAVVGVSMCIGVVATLGVLGAVPSVALASRLGECLVDRLVNRQHQGIDMGAASIVGAGGGICATLGDFLALPHIAVADGDGFCVPGAVVHRQVQSVDLRAAVVVNVAVLVVAALGVLGVVPGVAVADGLDIRLVHRVVDGQIQSHRAVAAGGVLEDEHGHLVGSLGVGLLVGVQIHHIALASHHNKSAVGAVVDGQVQGHRAVATVIGGVDEDGSLCGSIIICIIMPRELVALHGGGVASNGAQLEVGGEGVAVVSVHGILGIGAHHLALLVGPVEELIAGGRSGHDGHRLVELHRALAINGSSTLRLVGGDSGDGIGITVVDGQEHGVGNNPVGQYRLTGDAVAIHVSPFQESVAVGGLGGKLEEDVSAFIEGATTCHGTDANAFGAHLGRGGVLLALLYRHIVDSCRRIGT